MPHQTKAADLDPDLNRSRAPLSDIASALARAAHAPNTRRSYAAQWRQWSLFAKAHRLCPLPADPAAVANWLAERALPHASLERPATDEHPDRRNEIADGRHQTPDAPSTFRDASGSSVTTLRSAVAAISAAHRAAGFPFDSRDPSIQLVLRGVRNTQTSPPRQAQPLRGQTVAAILASLGSAPRDCRDGAILALGYGFARRRSELSGLDFECLGRGTGTLSLRDDCLEVRIFQSKSTVRGSDIFVLPRRGNHLAVRAIERWIKQAKILPGEPVLRRLRKSSGITPDRLDPQSIAHVIKARVEAYLAAQGIGDADVTARAFSGHSLRVGFAVSAAEAGAGILAIQSALGHASPVMSSRYSRAAEKVRTSPLRLRGVALVKPRHKRRKKGDSP